jgi:hypothetical protein
LDTLSTTDPHSRQLLAAQIIWTLSRSGINGPYVITADGAALDDRFAEGWETSDVAATDPGAFPGAAAGLHGLTGGSLVFLDGPRAPRVPGAFGQTPNQTAAAVSRTGQNVASIVTLRPGAPDMASSLWVGPLGGNASQALDGRNLTRPSWALDDAVWVVVDGTNVVRVIQDASGQPARIPVDSTPVSSRFPGAIRELQLSRDGTRAAMVIDGRVVLAGVEQTPGGGYALTYPRRLGFGLGNTVVSLSWRTGDDIVVSRTDPQHPVSYVNLDGVNSDGPSRNLLMPVTTVAANPSTVYVADERGVLQLTGSVADNDPVWSEVRPLMVPGALPVLPG